MATIQAATAGDGFTVEESVLIADTHTGEKREVDVLVSGRVAGQELRIGIECRDHGRPQTVEWIDQLEGKYRDLPVDMVIAVSSSGFTPAAATKAKKLRIGTLTLAEASAGDWQGELPTLLAVSFHGYRTDLSAINLWSNDENATEAASRLQGTSLNPEILAPSGEPIGTVDDLAHGFLKSRYLYEYLLRPEHRVLDVITGEAALRTSGCYAILPNGSHLPVDAITVAFSSERVLEQGTTAVKYSTLGETKVAHGALDLGGWKATVVVASEPGSPARVATALWEKPATGAGRAQPVLVAPLRPAPRWIGFASPVAAPVTEQSQEDLITELDSFRISSYPTPNRVVVKQPESFDRVSAGQVRPQHAIEHVRDHDALEVYEVEGTRQFLATRLVRAGRGHEDFVILVFGTVNEDQLEIEYAYRLYDDGDVSLAELSRSPALALAVLAWRYGMPFTIDGCLCRARIADTFLLPRELPRTPVDIMEYVMATVGLPVPAVDDMFYAMWRMRLGEREDQPATFAWMTAFQLEKYKAEIERMRR